MQINQKTISVVMINYNGMPWLNIAARSVLTSEDVQFELVIVDDCSADGSRDFITSLAKEDGRVKPILLEKNLGISGARNAGIDAASGDFISLIDSDDRFLPDTLKRQLETFTDLAHEKHNLSLLMSDAWLINEKGARVGRYISKDWWGRTCADAPPLWTLPSTYFFRKNHSARFHDGYRSADGPIFVSRMQNIGPVAFTGAPLIEYRLRMSSVTNHSGEKMLREMNAAEISKRLGRLDNPVPAEEVPAPDARDLGAWIHGRNAKNAAANGKFLVAVLELTRAVIAHPAKTYEKILRALGSFGRRYVSR